MRNTKYIICLLLMLSCRIASCQVLVALIFGKSLNTDKLSFGLVASPVLTNIGGLESHDKIGLNIGIYFNIKLSDRWYIHPESLAKASFGAGDIPPYGTGNAAIDSLYTDGAVSRKINAVSLPLLMRYRIAGLLFVEGGFQPGLIIHAKDVFKTTIGDNKLDYTVKVTDQFTRLDLGYAVGLSYKLTASNASMSLGLRYYGGIIDIMKNIPSGQYNRALSLNICVPIGVAGKVQ